MRDQGDPLAEMPKEVTEMREFEISTDEIANPVRAAHWFLRACRTNRRQRMLASAFKGEMPQYPERELLEPEEARIYRQRLIRWLLELMDEELAQRGPIKTNLEEAVAFLLVLLWQRETLEEPIVGEIRDGLWHLWHNVYEGRPNCACFKTSIHRYSFWTLARLLAFGPGTDNEAWTVYHILSQIWTFDSSCQREILMAWLELGMAEWAQTESSVTISNAIKSDARYFGSEVIIECHQDLRLRYEEGGLRTDSVRLYNMMTGLLYALINALKYEGKGDEIFDTLAALSPSQ